VKDMNQTKTILLEQVSALADGQLDTQELECVMAHAGQSGELQAAWQRYHLIGDVLRAGRHERCTDSSAFVLHLQQRIALEPLQSAKLLVVHAARVVHHRMDAANEPMFRWKLLAGVASMAAAVAIGWGWVGKGPAPAGAQLAQTRQPQPASDSVLAQSTSAGADASWITGAPATLGVSSVQQPQTMIRDARLDELLAAHHQATGGLQPSVFLRNAIFEGPSR